MSNMNGKFFMSDVYGGIYGTTEMTIPEAQDKQALVEDEKEAVKVEDSHTKGFPILLAVILIFVVALIFGGIK